MLLSWTFLLSVQFHFTIYQQIINNKIAEEIESLDENLKDIKTIDEAEASKIIATYIGELVKKKLDVIYESSSKNKIEEQISLANKLIDALEIDSTNLVNSGEQLLGIMDKNDPRLIIGKKAKDIQRPETSIAFSNLFTGTPREPQMLSELKKEIATASRIDMLVSFIKWSGLRGIINELTEFTQNGGKLRVICTTYTGATDYKAIEKLAQLENTEIKISYDSRILDYMQNRICLS